MSRPTTAPSRMSSRDGDGEEEANFEQQLLSHVRYRVKQEVQHMASYAVTLIGDRLWDEFLQRLTDVFREASSDVCNCNGNPCDRPDEIELCDESCGQRVEVVYCNACQGYICFDGTSPVHRICRHAFYCWSLTRDGPMIRLIEDSGRDYLLRNNVDVKGFAKWDLGTDRRR